MKFEIFNNSSQNLSLNKLIQSLGGFAQKRFGFKKPPSIHFDSDQNNASLPLGKTGYYSPDTFEIHVFVDGRHPKDILRSIAHELVHHTQNEQGSLVTNGFSGLGYAQKNPHLRNMEKDAYERGNMCFRDWEDGYKAKYPTIYNERRNKMSLKEWKNKELGQQLMSKWGFKMNLDGLTEETSVLQEHLPMGGVPPATDPMAMGEPAMPGEECDPCGCPDDEVPVEMGAMPTGEPEMGMTRDLPMDLEDRIYEKIMEMIGNSK